MGRSKGRWPDKYPHWHPESDTRAELIIPLSMHDLPAVEYSQQEAHDAELHAAEADWRLGNAFAYCRGPGFPIALCCTREELDLARGRK